MGGRNSWLSMYTGYFSDQKVSGNKYEGSDDTGLCLSGRFVEAASALLMQRWAAERTLRIHTLVIQSDWQYFTAAVLLLFWLLVLGAD